MAQIVQGAAVVVNGFDLSQYFSSVEEKAAVDLKDASVLGTTGARQYAGGMVERDLSGEGFFHYDGVTDAKSLDKLFNDAFSPTQDLLFSIGEAGATVGSIAKMLNTKQANYSIKESVGDLIMVALATKATLNGSTIAFARGTWLMYQTVTGAINGTSFDNAAATSGWVAHAHNSDSDGTATVKIQHSTDNSTWVDLINFGAIPSRTAAAQNVDAVTTVNRYVRAIVTAIGGTTNRVSVAMKIKYS